MHTDVFVYGGAVQIIQPSGCSVCVSWHLPVSIWQRWPWVALQSLPFVVVVSIGKAWACEPQEISPHDVTHWQMLRWKRFALKGLFILRFCVYVLFLAMVLLPWYFGQIWLSYPRVWCPPSPNPSPYSWIDITVHSTWQNTTWASV